MSTWRIGLPSRVSPLRVAMQLGLVRGYAAHHVWAEVPRVLRARAAQARAPFEVLEQLWWEDYVPLIFFVDCAGLPSTPQARTLARRDSSDTNTLLLAGLIAPAVVIAEDPDILASDLAYEQWTHFYEASRAIGTGKAHLTSVSLLTVLSAHGLAGAARGAARLARGPVGKGVALLAAVALIASVIRWGPAARIAWSKGSTTRQEVLREFGTVVAAFLRRLERAEQVWRAAERGEAGTTLEHRIASTLSSAEGPMTRTELVGALGLPVRRSSMDRVGNALHGLRAFVQVTDFRWQLGRECIDFGGTAFETA